jgi:hypothetical protein
MRTTILALCAIVGTGCGNDDDKKKTKSTNAVIGNPSAVVQTGNLQIHDNQPDFKGSSVYGYTIDEGDKPTFAIIIDDGRMLTAFETLKNVKYECRVEKQSESPATQTPSIPSTTPTAVNCTNQMFVMLANTSLPAKTTYSYDADNSGEADKTESADDRGAEITAICGSLFSWNTQAKFSTLPKAIGDNFSLELTAAFFKFEVSSIIAGSSGQANKKKFHATVSGKVIANPTANIPKCPEGQAPFPVGT